MAFKKKSTEESFCFTKRIHEFLHEATAKQIMWETFSHSHFFTCLSFLVDIFESMNSVSLALQRKITGLHFHKKIDYFQYEVLRQSKLDNKNFAPFA